jgi:hypothetical protein
MAWSWFGEPGDASRAKHTAELTNDGSRIRYVVKGVIAQNPIDAFIWKIDLLPVEDEEVGGRACPDDW